MATLPDALAQGLERAAVEAARACEPWIGKGDQTAADAAAVTAMRAHLNTLPMDGRIVIGEGERDEAPMLHIGETLGTGGPEIDIAVDPLEGTALCAENRPGALCVLAYGPRGSLLHAPDIYMDKIAVGRGLPLAPCDLDCPLAPLLARIAALRGRPARVLMLDRARHAAQMSAARAAGADLSLIADGDVMACLQTALNQNPLETQSQDPAFDLYWGTGGAPEGVLAACGLQHLGGAFFGRLRATSAAEQARADRLDLGTLDRVYAATDLASPRTRLILAGVTDQVLRGVHQGQVQVMTIDSRGVQIKSGSLT